MNNAEKIAAIMMVVNTWTENNNADEGDKFLSDPHLAMDAIDDILGGDITGAVRDGFIRE
jgi:hypothetical protein